MSGKCAGTDVQLTAWDCVSAFVRAYVCLYLRLAVGDAGVRHGRGSPDLCQALGSLSIGKRKEVTNQVERKQQGFPSKRAKTVAEYAK